MEIILFSNADSFNAILSIYTYVTAITLPLSASLALFTK